MRKSANGIGTEGEAGNDNAPWRCGKARANQNIPPQISRLKAAILTVFRQAAWLLTASRLPSKLRTLWRLIAREITESKFHRTKKPRKHKAPRPF
jgi:hypothetical protein